MMRGADFNSCGPLPLSYSHTRSVPDCLKSQPPGWFENQTQCGCGGGGWLGNRKDDLRSPTRKERTDLPRRSLQWDIKEPWMAEPGFSPGPEATRTICFVAVSI